MSTELSNDEGHALRHQSSLELLRKRSAKEAYRLVRNGDLTRALALFGTLPPELRAHRDVQKDYADLLERIRSKTRKHARQLLLAGDLSEAIALFAHLPDEVRDRPEVIQDRLQIIQHLRKRVQREVRELHQNGDSSSALAVYDRIPIEIREDPAFLHDRGRLLRSLGWPSVACEVLRKALIAHPKRLELLSELGLGLADLGRTKELKQLIESMLTVGPPTFETFNEAARLAKRGMLLHMAAELFENAVSLLPLSNVLSIVETAEALLKQGAQGRVINLLDSERVRLDPDLGARANSIGNQALAELRLAGWNGNCQGVADRRKAVSRHDAVGGCHGAVE